MEANESDPRLDGIIAELASIEQVFVLVTDESQKAFHDAVVANPGKTISELGVTTEDRVHAIDVGDLLGP